MQLLTFSYLPIKARLDGMDNRLEVAAGDLYAPPFRVFRRITLPLLWPGILAAQCSFVISLDDVIITEFVNTRTGHFTNLYAWSAKARHNP